MSWEPRAYAKVILHAQKHAENDVCGVLLGRSRGATRAGTPPLDADASTTSSERSVAKTAVEVVDSVPSFHSVTLAPMFEIAIEHINRYCELA